MVLLFSNLNMNIVNTLMGGSGKCPDKSTTSYDMLDFKT